MKAQHSPKTVDDYIAAFPKDVQPILQKMRTTIKEAAPEVEEAISYQIPTFKLNGHYLIYFAAYKKHIGLYPVPIGDAAFKKELLPYASGKATLKFPLNDPIPYKLVSKIVKVKVKNSLAKVAVRKK